MATAALAVRVRGAYREVEGAGYARATGAGPLLSFDAAGGTWGVVRAYALDGGAWVALAAPVLVAQGQAVALDVATGTLTPVAAATVAAPARQGTQGRWGR